jgi:hypothetical protein
MGILKYDEENVRKLLSQDAAPTRNLRKQK